MSMMHFDPERELLTQRAILPYLVDERLVANDVLNEDQPGLAAPNEEATMVETLKSLVEQASLPGIRPGDFEIALQGENLTITCRLHKK